MQKSKSAFCELIHMAIWARPDLAHCVSVLGRYVHNPSQKYLDAYLRVARYLIKTKDLRIVYGTHDTHGLVLYGFSDSDWGADPDSYRSTGAYIFFLDVAACSWKVKLSSTAILSSQESESSRSRHDYSTPFRQQSRAEIRTG